MNLKRLKVLREDKGLYQNDLAKNRLYETEK